MSLYPAECYASDREDEDQYPLVPCRRCDDCPCQCLADGEDECAWDDDALIGDGVCDICGFVACECPPMTPEEIAACECPF